MNKPCIACAIEPSVENLILASSLSVLASKISKVTLLCEVAFKRVTHKTPSSSAFACGLGTNTGSETKIPASFHVMISLESTSTL